MSSLSREYSPTADESLRRLSGLFPADFNFGTATAAYQIEGAAHEDGRGESIWDRFSGTPGKTFEGHTGEVACDHYHRYLDDIDLMSRLGVNSYRLSIAWPRILPNGTGTVNQKGLDFYNRLIDALLERSIEPYVTLHHWDLPQALEDRGGWYSRDTAEAFGEFAAIVLGALGDRVHRWITVNEPWVVAWIGHGEGRHAPGKADGPTGAIKAGHHLLLAHARAVDAVRSLSPKSRVGITLDMSPVFPFTDSAEDARAATLMDATKNRWFLEPVLWAQYPTDIPAYLDLLPEGAGDDMSAIAAPTDFVGVNYYSRAIVGLDPATQMPQVKHLENVERTGSGWEVYADGLRDLLIRLQEEYRVPSLLVTENGAAYAGGPDGSGHVRDGKRIDYLAKHLNAAAEAIDRGAKLDGYFVWSLLDNFEWASGYDDNTRFGIVHVDFDTQDRTIKDSGHWYSQLITTARPSA